MREPLYLRKCFSYLLSLYMLYKVSRTVILQLSGRSLVLGISRDLVFPGEERTGLFSFLFLIAYTVLLVI